MPNLSNRCDMEEYLTTKELSDRIKMAPGTIRNLVWRRQFKESIHYLKPTRRKILFIWSAVEDWLHGKRYDKPDKCSINI